MVRFRRFPLAGVILFLSSALTLSASQPAKVAPRAEGGKPDLSQFRTVEQAVTTRISLSPPTVNGQPAFLGVNLDVGKDGKLVVVQVEGQSAAASAGLTPGDVVLKADGREVSQLTGFKDLLHGKSPGDILKLAILRQGKPAELTIPLGAPSRPLSPTAARAIMGVRTAETREGVRIDQLTPGFPAEKAGLRTGDVILRVNGVAVAGPDKLSQILGEKKPGDTVTVAIKRAGKDQEVKVGLVAEPTRNRRRWSWDRRDMGAWRKPLYRLAVVPIEYPDVKHNEKVKATDWQKALFSQGVYRDQSPTGQKVYGSLNDYYRELSCEKFHIEGKVFDYIEVKKKRNEYLNGYRFALLGEALDKLLDRDGEDALKEFDGIFFLYAGNRVQTVRGGLYWPHRASFPHKGKRWGYFICPEGGQRMASISVIAHEFGHMLGLPDLYAQPDNPTGKGLGVWCTMSTGHGEDGKPLHFSAWCKEQLGWIKPAVLDPRVKQKLILAPIENSARECYKVLIRPDGKEYLLLENRVAKGFDRDLPGQGLLIWRVVDGRPVLEESHGINGPEGPYRFLGSIPYPSSSNHAYTPLTTPSSKPRKEGGQPVHITNIRKLPDGRITFWIGYEYL
jgi:M6 family metalloprotease-like protein